MCNACFANRHIAWLSWPEADSRETCASAEHERHPTSERRGCWWSRQPEHFPSNNVWRIDQVNYTFFDDNLPTSSISTSPATYGVLAIGQLDTHSIIYLRFRNNMPDGLTPEPQSCTRPLVSYTHWVWFLILFILCMYPLSASHMRLSTNALSNQSDLSFFLNFLYCFVLRL